MPKPYPKLETNALNYDLIINLRNLIPIDQGYGKISSLYRMITNEYNDFMNEGTFRTFINGKLTKEISSTHKSIINEFLRNHSTPIPVQLRVDKKKSRISERSEPTAPPPQLQEQQQPAPPSPQRQPPFSPLPIVPPVTRMPPQVQPPHNSSPVPHALLPPTIPPADIDNVSVNDGMEQRFFSHQLENGKISNPYYGVCPMFWRR